MTRRTIGVWVTTAACALLAACSGGDGVSAPVAPAAPSAPSNNANAALNTAAVNHDVAVTTAAAVMADLDNFAISDVFGLAASGSVNVPVVRFGDNPPPSGSSSSSTNGSSTGGDDEHKQPAGAPPDTNGHGNPCHMDGNDHEMHCSSGSTTESSTSTVTFVDAHGTKTNGFIRGVTDTVRTQLAAMRKVVSSDSAFQGVTYRNSNRAVGGFLDSAGTRTTNGVGTGADTTKFVSSGKTRSYAGTGSDTVKALVYAEHRAQNPYPKSGVMIHVVHSIATANDGAGKVETVTVDRKVTVTYDGSAIASIVVSGGTPPTTTTCQLHLDTRKVDGCH